MTPKEKAIQIVDDHYSISGHSRFSKAYAITTVRHIMQALQSYGLEHYESQNMDSEIRFWNQVEIEINAI